MNKRIIIALLATLSIGMGLRADAKNILAQKLAQDESEDTNATFYFQYEDTPLTDVIGTLAELKQYNVILPTGAKAITSKLTFSLKQPVTLDEAWDILQTVLDVANYSLLPHGPNMYSIVPQSKTMYKDAVPLYITSAPEKLPSTDDYIRYLYFFSNIKLSEDPKSEVALILTELLSENGNWKMDLRTNGVLITDNSQNIKSIINILGAIDNATFQEKAQVFPLRYTEASTIADLFNKNILNAQKQPGRYNLKKGNEINFFSEQVKIVPDIRTNKLIVLGKEQSINRVKDFIYKYLDVQLESGKSILHVYELQYLEAAEFAGVLENIVKGSIGNEPDQAASGPQTKGLDRNFQGVIIRSAQAKDAASQFSSNKLIIAAKNEDWVHIKKLIEQLDIPQPQVIIEVLVADLTIDDIRQLGASIRNPANMPFSGSGNVSIQAGNDYPIVLDEDLTTMAPTNNLSVAADLFAVTNQLNGSTVATAPISAPQANLAGYPGEPGSTLVSFNDPQTGRTWSMLELLQTFGATKIISHPHVLCTADKEAYIEIGEERLLPDEANATASNPIITYKKYRASLVIKITPRISSADTVNLAVDVNINQFAAAAATNNNTIITRSVVTRANVKNNEILSLGGLITDNISNTIAQTPILSKIPILGWFFKSRRLNTQKTNLTVFISPTIVTPRLRGGVSDYTRDYVTLAKNYSNEAQLFDTLRDPITRFFFRAGPEMDVNKQIDQFLAVDEFQNKNFPTHPGAEPVGPINTTLEPSMMPIVPNAPIPYVKMEPLPGSPASIIAQNKPEQAINDMLQQKNMVLPPNRPLTRDEQLKALLAKEENPLLRS